MDGLTRFGIERSRLTILAMIGVLLVGLMTYVTLPKRENPAITIRSAVVIAQFPGMEPERVEELLATPLERAARELTQVEDISSLVTVGQVKLTVEMFEEIASDDLEVAFQDLRTKMEDSVGELPEGSLGPFVNTDYGDVAVATIAVTGDGYDYAEIYDAAEDLQQGLYQVEGITKVTLSGEQDERIWLEIDNRRLASVGAQISTVLADLRSQNVILPAGEIDASGTNIVLEANGDLETVEELENVLTQLEGSNNLIRLRDLMTVRRGFVDPMQNPIFFNGEPAVLVSVEMSDDRDIQKIGSDLKTAIPLLEQKQPLGISFNISTFQETNVTMAINNALSNVAQTFVVVLLVMLVFLGIRPALIVACIVPFTVTFALVGMSQLGIDIEQISIAAVIISLGLLVDNGLVVVEDIEARILRGTDPEQAAIEAGGQFFVPLAVASVTTVSAFIPMLILDGTSGEFAFSLGAVVAIMLLGSWLTAHYILPFLAARTLKPKAAQDGENTLVSAYGVLIRKTLRFGIPIIVLCYGIVFLGSTVFGSLKSEQFPLSERAEYLVYLNMPKGTAISATRAETLRFVEWLHNEEINPEVANTTAFIGHGGPRFYLALEPADTDPSSSFIVVNTNNFEEAVAASERARRYLYENHPAARARVTRLSMGGSESGIVEIEIRGPDADVMLAAAKRVEEAFAEVPGIILNENDWGNKTLKITMNVLQEKARELGTTSEDISNVMAAYFSGATVSTFRDGSDSIPIVVRAEDFYRDSIEDLMNLSIPTANGLISLDQVAVFDPRLELSQLRRENQVRQIIIYGKSETMAATEVEKLLAPTLASLDLGPDYEIEIEGESANAAESNEKLAAGMPYALIVMIAALVFQFNSFRRVLLTFMTIPLILAGAPLALAITGMPLSFFGILGLISLMGIIINNAIVLIDQIDIERKTLSIDDAIVAASKKRVTPVLLTSLTTVLGLLPMAIAGGALFEPMAALMIGGLVLASPLTLIFVPPVYRLLFIRDAKQQTSAVTGAPA